MIKITKKLVSQDVINKRSYGKGNPVTGITVHQTGNRSKGANANMHARLQSRLNPRMASWHYQVDDKEVIQSFPDSVMCWAAGDGRGAGNTTTIQIETCINSDGDYKKAIQNTVKLVQLKMKEHNLKITDIKRHFDWSRKFCPEQLMRGHEGITWDDFLNMVEDVAKTPRPNNELYRVRKSWDDPKSQKGAYAQLDNAKQAVDKNKGYTAYDSKGKEVYSGSKPAPVKPKPTPQPKPQSKGNMRTRSIVIYLDSIKVDSSFKNRTKLAKKHNIADYKGTEQQNLRLLQRIRNDNVFSGKPRANLTVNGLLDYNTIVALQVYYETVADGVISKPSLVIMRLQKDLGVTQDGYMGKQTITALQRKMGTVQDGILSKPSAVIMELQKALNKGSI